MLRLLDKYLLWQLLIPFAYCLVGFLLFWILFDLFEDLEKFRGIEFIGIIRYYLVRLPELLSTVIPMALLLAALYSLSNHARHNELIAIRAAGISIYRISFPYIGVGLVCVGIEYILNEYLIPTAVAKAELILTQRRSTEQKNRWARDVTFVNQLDNRIWHITLYDKKLDKMWGVLMEWHKKDGYQIRIGAVEGIFSNKCWVFKDVRVLELNLNDLTYLRRWETNQLVWPQINEPPVLIKSEIEFANKDPLQVLKSGRLTIKQLLLYKKVHPELPSHIRTKIDIQLHSRIAEPWTCLVVVIIALPLAAKSGRYGTFATAANSLFLVFAYFFISRLLLGIGSGGYISSWLAAWFPNFIFMLLGLIQLRRLT